MYKKKIKKNTNFEYIQQFEKKVFDGAVLIYMLNKIVVDV